MKKYIMLAVLCAISCSQLMAQPELSLYFLPRAFQAQQTNPAFIQNKTFQLALPSVALQASHDGFRLQDLIQPVAGTDSFRLDLDGTIANMRDINHLHIDGRMDWLAVGFKVMGLQFNVSTATSFYSHVSYPKDIFNLAWEGNQPFVGQTLQVGPAFQAQAYHEIGVGLGLKLRDWVSVGAKVKYLIGLVDINMPRHDLSLLTTEDYYRLQFSADYRIRMSTLDLGNITDPTQIEPSLDFQPFTGNHGMSVDLGARFKLGERLDVAASVIDLGILTWNDNSNIYTAQGAFSFDGIDLNPYLLGDSLEMQVYIDSLANSLDVQTTSTRYTTALPAQLYVSAHYQLPLNFRLGGVLHATYFQKNLRPTLGLNVSKDFLRFLTLGLTYSVQQNRFDNLGAHLLIKAGPAVFFATSDHLISVINPQQAQLFNARIGLNWMFGGKG